MNSEIKPVLKPEQTKIDRPWSEYPIGTKAHSAMGGYWTKTDRGWKWCTGSTFTTPGGDALSVTIPGVKGEEGCYWRGGVMRQYTCKCCGKKEQVAGTKKEVRDFGICVECWEHIGELDCPHMKQYQEFLKNECR